MLLSQRRIYHIIFKNLEKMLTLKLCSISRVLFGIIADKLGRKAVQLVLWVCLAASTLAFGFSTTYAWAFTTRLMQGISIGINN